MGCVRGVGQKLLGDVDWHWDHHEMEEEEYSGCIGRHIPYLLSFFVTLLQPCISRLDKLSLVACKILSCPISWT